MRRKRKPQARSKANGTPGGYRASGLLNPRKAKPKPKKKVSQPVLQKATPQNPADWSWADQVKLQAHPIQVSPWPQPADLSTHELVIEAQRELLAGQRHLLEAYQEICEGLREMNREQVRAIASLSEDREALQNQVKAFKAQLSRSTPPFEGVRRNDRA